MNDSFNCPSCGISHNIGRLELWTVYDSDGEETEYNCTICGVNMIITSSIAGWEFEAEIQDN